MSSIDFHEDEWGRHWSHAPARQGRLPHRSHSVIADVSAWVAARMDEARMNRRAQRDRQAFERLDIRTLRDIFPEDHVLPVRRDLLESVRDDFGRPLP